MNVKICHGAKQVIVFNITNLNFTYIFLSFLNLNITLNSKIQTNNKKLQPAIPLPVTRVFIFLDFYPFI